MRDRLWGEKAAQTDAWQYRYALLRGSYLWANKQEGSRDPLQGDRITSYTYLGEMHVDILHELDSFGLRVTMNYVALLL